ncbi:hypothetical protein ABZY20_03730 [Streptomyces sp. NPDC006624]|uniref:hypothetical protein n=1 Tax=unclassified Streptomyces TaxID=2593676 RepID=UPI0033B17AD1
MVAGRDRGEVSRETLVLLAARGEPRRTSAYAQAVRAGEMEGLLGEEVLNYAVRGAA